VRSATHIYLALLAFTTGCVRISIQLFRLADDSQGQLTFEQFRKRPDDVSCRPSGNLRMGDKPTTTRIQAIDFAHSTVPFVTVLCFREHHDGHEASAPRTEDEECDTQGSLRLLANPGRFLVRLEPPGDQREEGESQRRGIFADGIADQNVRCRRAGHLKEDSGIGPFPESRESRPEQRTNCEDLPDSDNVQDESWITV
jgi:hypothetical protein